MHTKLTSGEFIWAYSFTDFTQFCSLKTWYWFGNILQNLNGIFKWSVTQQRSNPKDLTSFSALKIYFSCLTHMITIKSVWFNTVLDNDLVRYFTTPQWTKRFRRKTAFWASFVFPAYFDLLQSSVASVFKIVAFIAFLTIC